MKNLFESTRRISVMVLAIIICSGLVNAQSRYKHVPRVKVDVKHKKETTINQPETVNFQELNMSAPVENSTNMVSSENPVEETIVASTIEEPVLATHKTKNSGLTKAPVKQVKEKRKGNFDLFGDHFNIKSKLLKVKSVEKAQGTVGVILLISFYVLAILFTVLCIVFLLDVNPGSFTLFLVFLILAIVFALAGSIMLTLLKLGVI